MIAKLKGLVDTIGEDYCIIDVQGVGYLVSASSKTLARLDVGTAVSLLIETVVREDSISLFGFYDAWEKVWFNTLTKVQGVGAKVCLNILSALSAAQLSQAISAQDKSSFTRANGVGPKLAARIVTELKDKIVTIPVTNSVHDNTFVEPTASDVDSITGEVSSPSVAQMLDSTSAMDDAISALVNLGYQKLEAYRAVNKIFADNPDSTVSDLIRLSLKEFAPKDNK